jgi:hypothetical protein
VSDAARCAEVLTQGQTRWSIPLFFTPMLSSGFYSALARSILAGEPEADAVAARIRRTLGENWRWIRSLAERYAREFGGKTRPTRRDVIEFLRTDEGLNYAKYKYREKLRIANWVAEPARMQPVQAARAWAVPRIESVGELAAWLNVSPNELEWFADLKRMNARTRSGTLHHYHYRVLAKKSGNIRLGNIRLIEAPKEKLKEL